MDKGKDAMANRGHNRAAQGDGGSKSKGRALFSMEGRKQKAKVRTRWSAHLSSRINPTLMIYSSFLFV